MNIFLDCDGVINSLGNARRKFIPNRDNADYDNWAEWHNHFDLEKPNVEGMKLIRRLITPGDTVYLLSLRHTGLENRTYEYVKDHKMLPGLKLCNILFCPPEIEGNGAYFKRSILEGFTRGAQRFHGSKVKNSILFIDDSMENLEVSKDIATTLYYPTFRG